MKCNIKVEYLRKLLSLFLIVIPKTIDVPMANEQGSASTVLTSTMSKYSFVCHSLSAQILMF